MRDTQTSLHFLATRALLELVDDVSPRRGVTSQELLERSRTRAVVGARQELWWLIRHHPGRCHGCAEIAALVGRDPSTVAYGIAAHERRQTPRRRPTPHPLRRNRSHRIPLLKHHQTACVLSSQWPLRGTRGNIARMAWCTVGVVVCAWCLACSPRSEALEPGECGSVVRPREPSASFEDRPRAAAQARRLADGGVHIFLGPIIRRTSNTPLRELVPDDLSLSFDSDDPVSELTIGRVSPDAPAELEVLLLLDTSRTMGWAIDAARATAGPFAARLEELGFEPRFGGMEFGDELRTRTDLGTLAQLERWLDTLTPIGGGDLPSSGVDAIYRLPFDFGRRLDVTRYAVLITQSGLHERDDGSTCSEREFSDARVIVGSTFLVALFPEGEVVGIHPEQLARGVGGLAVPIAEEDREALLSLPDVADTMNEMYTITVPAEVLPTDPVGGTITYPVDGEELEVSFVLPPS